MIKKQILRSKKLLMESNGFEQANPKSSIVADMLEKTSAQNSLKNEPEPTKIKPLRIHIGKSFISWALKEYGYEEKLDILEFGILTGEFMISNLMVHNIFMPYMTATDDENFNIKLGVHILSNMGVALLTDMLMGKKFDFTKLLVEYGIPEAVVEIFEKNNGTIDSFEFSI